MSILLPEVNERVRVGAHGLLGEDVPEELAAGR